MRQVFLFLCLIAGSISHAQVADTSLPFYKRFPTITPFQILLSDSSTMYTRSNLPAGKPVTFVIFSPDCNHCQEEAEQIYANREKLKDMQIVMITMHSFAAMKDFISKYKLGEVPNLVVGRDVYYLMPSFYQFRHLPFHAMYNKEGKLLSVFEGSMNIMNLVNLFKE